MSDHPWPRSYPDTILGVRKLLTELSDLSPDTIAGCTLHPDPWVKGVWLAVNPAAPFRAIVYTQAADFEVDEGATVGFTADAYGFAPAPPVTVHTNDT